MSRYALSPFNLADRIIIDSELDIYNDYMTLFRMFGDQEYKDRADESMRVLQKRYSKSH